MYEHNYAMAVLNGALRTNKGGWIPFPVGDHAFFDPFMIYMRSA